MAHRWYIVHAYSGSENAVSKQIEERAEKKGLSEYVSELLVPSEEVVEIRAGQRVNVNRVFFPGYVLIKAELTDQVWHMIRDIPKVSGFLGARGKPQPISEKEANEIMARVEEGAEKPKHRVLYEVGETVKVIDGAFENFTGLVEEVDDERGRLKVSVSIFGRATPVDLEFIQVEKYKE